MNVINILNTIKMDISELHANPVLFDELIIGAKFGSDFERSSLKQQTSNDKIRTALLENELSETKKKLAQKETRDGFTGGGCGCGSIEGMHKGTHNTCKSDSSERPLSDDLNDLLGVFNNRKFLIILVFVLAAFCIVQYFNHKNETREMIDLMCAMLKQQGNTKTEK
jgi:hypothetical protein